MKNYDIKLTHEIINRFEPYLLMNDYEKGTKIAITNQIKDLVCVSNGRTEGWCHISQIKKLD